MKIKKLHFAEPLPDLILSGKKDTTWRINDEKNIEVGDTLIFLKKNVPSHMECGNTLTLITTTRD